MDFSPMETEECEEENDCKNGWMVYVAGKTEKPVDMWLQKHLPSDMQKSDGIEWISVQRPRSSPRLMPDLEGLMESWENFQTSGRVVNYQNIKELACNHNVLTGKWFFFSDSGGKIDHLWSVVARNVVSKDLPCNSAKVSAYDENTNHVVCVYNDNFTNSEEVLMSDQAIRSFGIKCEMMYKPDVYTHLGIYSGNTWKISPYIMKSVFDLIAGKSLIESFI